MNSLLRMDQVNSFQDLELESVDHLPCTSQLELLWSYDPHQIMLRTHWNVSNISIS